MTSKIIREKVIEMLKNNIRNKDISKQLGISSSLVSKINKNYVKSRF